ncbi:hypothetical protein DVJ78_01245 [Humibacter sp. BT305]|uniref:Bacterial Pleckstrin homology domain-containing protein n=1 Tax=Cnuibacter physcomitrellae TaxID=1619308 RepID=A0A1X9LQ71_9MICO|nr:hypothetical protein [Cnuibacter physcomitrellae]ARJ04040.1 hypothetical protein B5808_01435 [Cnuibacter physcomitrellae]AXH34231.1 hypothetical protein DVJ78_01245 [Humibacter sp. BT305]MCS5497225.1 hypothetical protein [Cnuibacter physcomitrellae]
MAVLFVHTDRLEIRLTRTEKLLSFRRTDIVIPLDDIKSAVLTDDPWIWVRGIRAPGSAIPLTLAIGTWKHHDGKDFLIVKRTRSAVVIDLERQEYSRLIVTTSHAVELLRALRLPPEEGTERIDV